MESLNDIEKLAPKATENSWKTFSIWLFEGPIQTLAFKRIRIRT